MAGCAGAIGFALLTIIPAAKLFGRLGFPQWTAIGAVMPGINIVLLWYVAFSKWPRAEQNP
jgi:hypothetical protein